MKTQNLRLNVQPLANYVCTVQFPWQAFEIKKRNKTKQAPNNIYTFQNTANPSLKRHKKSLQSTGTLSASLLSNFLGKKKQKQNASSRPCDFKKVKHLKYLYLSVLAAQCALQLHMQLAFIPHLCMGENLKYRSPLQLLYITFQ